MSVAMPHYVEPSGFKGHQAHLQVKAPGNFAVVVAGMTAGRIMLQPRLGGREFWF